MIGDFRAQCLRALHGDVVETSFDVAGFQAVVPCDVHVRRGHPEAIAMNLVSHVVGISTGSVMAIQVQTVEWQGPAGFTADIIIFRAAANHAVVLRVDVSDVDRLLDEDVILGVRQAMMVDRTTEVAGFHETEPQRADAESRIHSGVPMMTAVCQGFRWKRGPSDVAAAAAP